MLARNGRVGDMEGGWEKKRSGELKLNNPINSLIHFLLKKKGTTAHVLEYRKARQTQSKNMNAGFARLIRKTWR